ncbi:MAG: ATP-binding protein, partial [Myxococcota bacterium]|nr:ATP-binding protein [Myxococcota bacterium]
VEDEHGVFLLTVEDRTAAITASRTITSIERLFRSIFERIPIGALIASPSGRVITMNESYGRLVNMREETASDLRSFHISSPEVLPSATLIPATEKLLDRHPFRIEVETGYEDAESWVAINGFPVLDSDGEVLRLLLLAVDVSTRRRNERRIRQVESMEATGRLAGGLAHDINNTITSVAGYAELLLATETDPKRIRYLSQIAAGASQVTTLIETLSQLGRPEDKGAGVVDAGDLIRREGERLHRQLEAKFKVQVSEAAGQVPVRCSASALEDAIARLTRNAVESLEEGGEIHLSAAAVEPGANLRERFPGLTAGTCGAITIRDSGVGIPAAEQHRVFEPYVTSKGPGTRKGTGLGLAIVYAFVQESGGAIELDSAPGTGTRVTMYLPSAYEL